MLDDGKVDLICTAEWFSLQSNHDIPPASAIIDEDRIHKLLEETREDARDAAVRLELYLFSA